ncbi:sciellin isoform X2 [Hippoglossus hippoglossus]|uniref:sciellin isoform X2 n=1 Tax=Hippoglossus hippoglossus TaxID=8267 RepID=UPI00148D7D2F|nr:sciellin isoform X2 [Hippoglossus hippoglossus]
MSRYTNQTSKVTNLLKDGSWIRKDEEEDEDVDRDPNFGKSILGRYKTSETVVSGGSEVKTTKTISTTTSVNALSKRFSETLEEPKSSTLPSSTSISPYTKRTSSVTEEPKSSTTTRTLSKDGKTTETTITTSQSVSSPVMKSPTMTETFTERVKSSSQGGLYSKITPTRTSKVTETTVTTNKGAEEKLYDTLLPSGIKDDYSSTESKRTISTTQTSIVRSSNDTDAEDQLYGTLIPSAIKDDFTDRSSRITRSETVTVESSRGSNSPTLTSPSFTGRLSSYKGYSDDSPTTRTSSYTVSTTPSDPYSSDRQSYSRTDSSYDRSISSPTAYSSSSSSSSYRSRRSDDNLGDSTYSRSSTKSLYGSTDRLVLEKDLCTYCRKPFTGDAKMVLDDLKINCHATCFKCEVCNSTLGHMKAGDSMWIYNRMVHCENCFEVTRDKWRR